MIECPLCNRLVPPTLLEAHHLKTRRKDRKDTEDLCGPCHRQVHVLFRDADLRDPTKNLDTVDGILANPDFQRFLLFVRKQDPNTSITVRESARKRRRR